MIPDNDRRVVSKWSGTGLLHQDHSVTHQLLNGFKVSFLWKPVINERLITVFKKWNVDDFQVPSLIFLGKLAISLSLFKTGVGLFQFGAQTQTYLEIYAN